MKAPLAAAVLALTAAPARAEEVLPSAAKSILFWSPAEQEVGYRNIEKIFPTRVIRAGAKVHPLPQGAPIKVAYDFDGRRMTTDSFMAANRVAGIVVIKDGKVRLERYALGLTPDQRWTSFSVAKSVTSTLVGAAIKDGHIRSLDDPVVRYIPDLKGSAYEGVTVRQVITMTSGVKWNEDYADARSDVARAGFTPVPAGMDSVVGYMKDLPREAEPGTRFVYKTGETDLGGSLVAGATGMPVADYLSEKLWIPYGMEKDAIWMLNAAGNERGGCCISMTLRDYGRVGQFMLDGGVADGRQLLPDGWTKEATVNQIPPQTDIPGYGYYWWVVGNGAYRAAGIFGQTLYVDPNENLVVVILSAWPKATDDSAGGLRAGAFAFIGGVKQALGS